MEERKIKFLEDGEIKTKRKEITEHLFYNFIKSKGINIKAVDEENSIGKVPDFLTQENDNEYWIEIKSHFNWIEKKPGKRR